MKLMEFFGLLASTFLVAGSAMADECDGYALHLKTCEPFVCKFKHPFTGKMMKKQIVGTFDGKCKTTEEMPNKGKLVCNLSTKARAAVSNELATLAAAQKVDSNVELDAAGKATTELKADSKSVKNALEDAMNSGECAVSGYSD